MKIFDLCNQVLGGDLQVPLLDGTHRRYVNFDNAASTSVLLPIQEGINRFLQWYSSIHRGAGFKSQLCTWAYEEARELILNFMGADSKERVVIFGKNTTEAINKLANRYPFKETDVLLTTLMEHHSNDLPWRRRVQIERIWVDDLGRINLDQLEQKLKKFKGRMPLVAVTGASNVSGIINPIYEIAKLAHEHGAEIFVDAAQLAPHRKIRMGKRGEAEVIDYLAISAHKMYAPYGTGALIGWQEVFEKGNPDYSGGGTVKVVTEEEVYWREPPDKEEAGSPNVVGAVALGLSVRLLNKIGMENVAQHESILTKRIIKGLEKLEQVELYGLRNYEANLRLGVVPFNIINSPHPKVAAILGCEFGVGVRNGCFCAHPYVKNFLHLSKAESDELIAKIRKNKMVDLPGMVRISFGLYNTLDEVDYVLDSIKKICEGKYHGNYLLNSQQGVYWPEGFKPSYRDYFSF
ncbi:MAG: aminotransferase class V-fold PLP-dependent enzyme [bacterium]